MSDLDARGYPHGYKPGWWICPACGDMFHDSKQKGDPHVAWDLDPECGACPSRGLEMRRISDLRAAAIIVWRWLRGRSIA